MLTREEFEWALEIVFTSSTAEPTDAELDADERLTAHDIELRALCDQLAEALKSVEWGSTDECGNCCPDCLVVEHRSHRDDCRLIAALDAYSRAKKVQP